MSEGRKKKGGGNNKSTLTLSITDNTDTNNNPNTSSNNSNDVIPIGDPFERILTTPKESLIQRTSSPRRGNASPLNVKGKGKAEICLEQLPKLSGTRIHKTLILIPFF